MDRAIIEKALDDERTDDLEDALQLACAERWQADQFVTRDSKLIF